MGCKMKSIFETLVITAIPFGIAFGWKGVLVIVFLIPIVWFTSLLESAPTQKKDQDTDAASIATIFGDK